MQNTNSQNGKQQTVRVNWLIKSENVRVIDGDGNNLGVMKTVDAIGKARQLGVDLIEINGKSSPPVARLQELGKFKYETKKKENEIKKNSFTVEVKELQLRPGTSDHDTNTKVRQALEFLNEGHHVKWSLKMRGRENNNAHIAFEKLKEVLALLGEKIVVLVEPRAETKMIIMVVCREK